MDTLRMTMARHLSVRTRAASTFSRTAKLRSTYYYAVYRTHTRARADYFELMRTALVWLRFLISFSVCLF